MKLREHPAWRLFCRMLGPLALILILVFGINLSELADVLSRVKVKHLIVAAAIIPAVVLVRSIRWRQLLEINGIPCPFFRCFRIYFVGFLAVNVLPAFGTVIRVVFFMDDDRQWRRALLSIFEDKYFDYVLLVIMGLVSVLLFLVDVQSWLGIGVLIAVVCAAFPIIRVITLAALSSVMPKKIRQWLESRGVPAEKFRTGIDQSLNWQVYVLSLAGCIIYYYIIYLLCRSLHISVSYPQVVLIESVTILTTLVPVSVLGIGTRDVGLLATFKLFGRSPEEAIALSALLLLFRFIIVFMGIPFWLADPPPWSKIKNLKSLLKRGGPSEAVTK